MSIPVSRFIPPLLSHFCDSISLLQIGGNIGWCSHYGERYGSSFKKLKIELLCLDACAFSLVCLFATPGTVACLAHLFRRFSQASILEWVAISFTRGSSQPKGLSKPGIKTSSLVSPALTGEFLFCFVLFCFITEPPRKPRTTIWSSNSTPGHLSREKHNSNRHMRNLKKAMVCCAVVSWVEKATWCRKAEGEGSPCCFQHRGPRVCWLTAPVLLCLHRSASWKSQWSQ